MRVSSRYLWLAIAVLAIGVLYWNGSARHGSDRTTQASGPAAEADLPRGERDTRPPRANPAHSYPEFLPSQAHEVLRRIAAGGPFDHRQDGSVFQNRENRLPRQPRGYYHEYTVETPGSDDRGARRIVTGGDPPREFYYSDDHYRSFRRFDVASGGAAR
ncbi:MULTISPECIES: ribonuclease domain-containing protein [unclassified Lysobacter]|uniref:ribonuclease domain-containing protein n=1 Tax=unclassified Lysobacter TaxID=2635362 RepID=UPI001BE9501E|nr:MULTISPECIES: ribonuclease domain-containing protein [unclassified Lysobacter]MBT2748410.1 ribonuclease [Lysobacter sp. ISL-42]MBT2749823.1 ribonuclease [Lysobacter sp. ISL-50]MBT2781151.1 ribonuclease [Lysobacter sp. ISL-52]